MAMYLIRRGVTIIELVVAIAVVAVLLALLAPAIQYGREAARSLACRNNLRQIALAAHAHESLYRHLPTGGWGWRWQGDPDRGFGPAQPGGWVYNVLPFMEQSPLHDNGAGLGAQQKAAVLAESAATPVKIFVCPSRRSPRALPYVHRTDFINVARPTLVARSDYAACSGDQAPDVQRGKGRGRQSVAEGDAPSFRWLDTDLKGVVFRRSRVKFADITDGLSNTYFAGEKYMARKDYYTGIAQNDDQDMLVGFDSDTLRTTDPKYPPKFDDRAKPSDHSFGSLHPAAFNMALADATVTTVSYDVDLEVHRMRGTRRDVRLTSQR